MANEKRVKFDGKRIADELKKRKIKQITASQFVMIKKQSYLTECISRGYISEESLKKLCGFLGIDVNSVIIKESEPEPKKEPKQFNFEDLIVGLNSLYNLENKILAEIKAQNEILRGLSAKKSQDSEMLKNINSNLNANTEKVKAIFTDIHYNK